MNRSAYFRKNFSYMMFLIRNLGNTFLVKSLYSDQVYKFIVFSLIIWMVQQTPPVKLAKEE